METNPIGVFVHYARSFYQMVGNRRKFERMPISETIRASCRGHAVETTHNCRSVDVSPRGIGMDCPEELRPDAVVELHSADGRSSRLACVRYCRPQGDGFRVGLEFMPK